MSESTVESTARVFVDWTEKTPIHVLHVDDDVGFLKAARQLLEMQGRFEVDTALSVKEAMEKLKEKTFDAVVSDYQMPERDGLDFLRELRDKGNNVPFIMFTGKGREDVAMKALNLGADRYLNKHGDPEAVYGELAYSVRQAVERERAQTTVKRSEEKFRSLFENARDVIVLMDLKGNVTAINKAAVEYGFKKEDVVGKSIRKFVAKRYWPKLLKELVQLARGKNVEGKIEIVTRKGKKQVEYWSKPILMDDKVVGVQSILKDVTELKRAEEKIRESDEKYRTLMDDAPIATFNVNLNGKITYVNKRFEQDTGYSREEILGKNAFKLDIVSDETRKFLAKRMRALLMGKPARCVEVQFRCKDGRWIWADMESRIIKKLRVPVGFQITARDITERKHAEEILRKSEEKLSALNIYGRRLNTAESMEKIYQLTLDAMEKTLGFEIAFFMIVDKNMLRVVDQRGYPRSLSIKLPLNGAKKGVSIKTARTGKPISVPDAGKEEDWVEFWPGIRSGLDVPVKIGHKVLGVIGVESKKLNAFDEKDRKLLEILALHAATAISNLEHTKKLKVQTQQSRESQQKFEGLFMDNPEAAVYVNPDFHILDVNPRFKELFGWSLKEIKGKHINSILVPQNKMEEARHLDEKAWKGYVYHDTVRKKKDGSLVPVAISAAPITIENKLVGLVALYKDVTERKKAERELEESREHFRTLFNVMVDPVVIVDGNGKFLEITDRVEEITGYKKEELLGKNFLRTKIVTAKSKAVLMKNLAKRMVGIHVAPYTVEVQRKDGRKLPYEVNAEKIMYKGKAADMVVFRDVSERKRMEEKLRVVGRLARHDVRNKLSAVTGNAYLLKKRLEGDSEAVERLNDIESAVRETTQIFDFARTYEKLGIEKLSYVNVEKTFNGAVQQFSDLQVKVVNDCRGLSVLADSLLTRLFYNLIDNSLKHGENVSKIRVYYEKEGDELKLVYEDDGVGIRKAEKEKVFREGYGKGTGYGLYLIRKMCQVYGWTIRETGKHGKGARFTITIPRTNSSGKTCYQLSQNK